MGSRTIRIDNEVYGVILRAKALLEISTVRPCSVGDALRFLLALKSWNPTEEGA